MTEIVTTYLACWNETVPTARRGPLAQHWAADATYADPLVAGLDVVRTDDDGRIAQVLGFLDRVPS